MKKFTYKTISILLMLAILITSLDTRLYASEYSREHTKEERNEILTTSEQSAEEAILINEQLVTKEQFKAYLYAVNPWEAEKTAGDGGTGTAKGYLIPVLGEIIPVEAGAMDLNGVTYHEGSWAYDIFLEWSGQEQGAIPERMEEDEEVIDLEQMAEQDHIVVDGQIVTKEQFKAYLDAVKPEDVKVISKSRMAGVIAIYAVPGLGEVALLVTAVIVVGGIVYEAGSWTYDTFIEWAEANEVEVPENKTEEEAYEDAKRKGEKVPDRHRDTTKHKSKGEREKLDLDSDEPYSSEDLYNEEGELIQRRYRDKNGKADEDIDFKHGDSHYNHKFPHRHKWVYDENGELPKKGSRPEIPMYSSAYMNPANAYRYVNVAFPGFFILEKFGLANFIHPPRSFDPLVLDLDGDGIHLISNEDHSVYFDLDMDDFAERTDWIGEGDGLLCLDSNGDQIINNNKELFGDQFILYDDKKSEHGFEALGQYDENKDAVIDQNDSIFNQLLIWQDENRNGFSEPAELSPLKDLAIQSIGLSYTEASGDNILAAGTYTREDGESLSINEYLFEVDLFYSLEEKTYHPSESVSVLPNLAGTGKVRSLHNAMMVDESGELEALVQKFTAETDYIKRRIIFRDILLKWTDSDKIDSSSRGGLMDAGKLNVLEAFRGEEFVGADSSGNPNSNAAQILNGLYDQLFLYFYSELYYQVKLKELFFTTEGESLELTDEIFYDTDQSIAYLEKLLEEEPDKGMDLLTELNQYVTESQLENFDVERLNLYFSEKSEKYRTILARECRNIIYGTDRNDHLTGTSQDELLIGGWGNDFLNGGTGNDTYFYARGYGVDTISDGTEGNQDRIQFADDIAPIDITSNRDGNNLVLSLNNEQDRLVISNYFYASSYKIWDILFSDGTRLDMEQLAETVKTIEGTEGGDNLEGFSTNDYIRGLGGNDSLKGYQGDDTLEGGTGNDSISGGDGSDRLYGAEGNDDLTGDAGDDLLDGGSGMDVLNGGTGNDIYLFGRGCGVDTISDYDFAAGNQDAVQFAEGIKPEEVTVTRDGGSLILSLNGTSDRLILSGYFSSPYYMVEKVQFADGTQWDKIKFQEAVKEIIGSEKEDILSGFDSDDSIKGLGGKDTINGADGNDMLDGGRGSDILSGGNGNDRLYGAEENDRLNGEAGEDWLDGGKGVDTLLGGTENDTYFYDRGYGVDTITDYDRNSGNQDLVQLGENIAPHQVTAQRDGGNLLLSLDNESDRLIITNYFSSPDYLVEKVEFADGTVWDKIKFDENAKEMKGTEEKDSLLGFESNDRISGLGGDDTICGYGGDDTLEGGKGNDILRGGNGSDFLYGAEGNDDLMGEAGNDSLEGGRGNDKLNGGIGNDNYMFGLDSGTDTIIDYDSNGENQDTIEFSEEILPLDVTAARDGSSLMLRIRDGGRLTVADYFSSPYYRIEKVQFADGTVWDKTKFEEDARELIGTERNDTMNGFETNDRIIGLGGDDTVRGHNGDDTCEGGNGNDTLIGGNGEDRLAGEKGNDSLDGGDGEDFLDGGLGTDALYGGRGNDVYYYGKGYGTDTIKESDGTAGNTDVILFADDITPEEVISVREGKNLVLCLEKEQDKVIVSNYFDSLNFRVEKVQFADATVWDERKFSEEVKNCKGTQENDILRGFETNDIIEGLGGDDSLYGEAGDDRLEGGKGNDLLLAGSGEDRLFGGEGNDNLNGEAGEDFLDGGTGADSLNGGSGNDSYFFDRGYGTDLISDYDVTAGNLDAVLFADTILPRQVMALRDGNNLLLRLDSGADKLIISDYFKVPECRVEEVRFGDGTVWDRTAFEANGKEIRGTENDDNLIGFETNDVIKGFGGDDRLYGVNGEDILEGGKGNDILYGEAGEDILDGGAGTDSLDGGTGNDTYLFGNHYGTDTITEYDTTAGNVDKIQFAADILPKDAAAAREGNNLVLSLIKGGDRLILSNYFSAPHYRVERAEFADGTVWDQETFKEEVTEIKGTEADEVLAGFDTNDTMRGFGGDDVLHGNMGEDTLDGGKGNDRLFGDAGNDVLFGAEGNDMLAGAEGSDCLDGGAGTDHLDGGLGSDIYLFGRGYGEDTISESDPAMENQDTVQLGDSILPDEVKAVREGTSLVVSIGNGTDRLIISNYFYSSKCRIEKIVFSDGTEWDKTRFEENVNKIEGTEENDTLSGFESNDTIYGFGGDDTMYSYDGDDILEGGKGNDVLNAGTGNDRLNGAEGNDNLVGEAGEDLLDGGKGTDTLNGGTGNDTYIFGRSYGTDTIKDYDSTAGNQDIIRFMDTVPEDVSIIKNGSNLLLSLNNFMDKLYLNDYFYNQYYMVEEIQFADGTVWDKSYIEKNIAAEIVVEGSNADDELYGTDQGETIYGLDGLDLLSGLDGRDNLYGGNGNDTLDGGKGQDYLEGGYGRDTYVYGNDYGVDTIILNSYDSLKDRIMVKDQISPDQMSCHRELNDLVLSLSPSDKLIVKNHYTVNKLEEVEFEGGTIWTAEYFAEKERGINGTSNNDTIYGFAADDNIHALAGDDMVYAQEGQDIVYGGEGNDGIYGENGNDLLYGEEGNDLLSGGSGEDVLEGGSGSDTLDGGIGNDVYIIRKGTGTKTIRDYDTALENIDTIKFADAVKPEDVSFERNGDALELYVNKKSKKYENKVIVKDYFLAVRRNDGDLYYSRTEKIEFEDGTVWMPEYFADHVRRMDGTLKNDTINGFTTEDIIRSLAGDDRVNAGAGNDFVYGGEGNDTISGEDGDDTLFGEDGNDSLYGNNGEDVLDGGSGTDTLEGGIGNDTYVIKRGSGTKMINDADTLTSNKDRIKFADGIKPEEVSFARKNSNLELYVNNVGNRFDTKVVITNYFYLTKLYGTDLYYNLIEQVEFEDGTLWTQEYFNENVKTIKGTTNNDILNGFAANDIIQAFSGDDRVNAGAGDDIVYGGDGNDIIYGEEGNDTLNGEEGNDALYGGDGDDRFDGGSGSDTLEGAAGSDTYLIRRGTGIKTINDYDRLTSNKDRLQFTDGIKPEDVSFLRNGDNLELYVNKGVLNYDTKVIVSNHFTPSRLYGVDFYYYSIEEAAFEDGTVWSREYFTDRTKKIDGTSENDRINGFATDDRIDSLAGDDIVNAGAGNDMVYGGAGNDTINGQDGDDILFGEEGNDWISGGDGNDSLDGGSGTDTLEGGTGADTYIIQPKSGISIVNDKDTLNADRDIIKFAGEIKPDEVSFLRYENNLELYVNKKNSKYDAKVIVTNYFLSTRLYGVDFYDQRMEQVEFEDGTVWNQEYFIEHAKKMDGTEGNDVINGFATEDTIHALDGDDSVNAKAGDDQVYGGDGNDLLLGEDGNDALLGEEGNDILYGGDGNDCLDGGTGTDTLDGGMGNDIYLFQLGSGIKTITDYDVSEEHGDTVTMEGRVNMEDILLDMAASDLVITFKTSPDDKLILKNYFVEGWKIEKFVMNGKVQSIKLSFAE